MGKVDAPLEKGEQYEPLGDLILVEPEKQKESVIIVGDDQKKNMRPNRGTVIKVGEGRFDQNGKLIPMRLKVGDFVMFHPNGYDIIGNKDAELYMMAESAVMLRITK